MARAVMGSGNAIGSSRHVEEPPCHVLRYVFAVFMLDIFQVDTKVLISYARRQQIRGMGDFQSVLCRQEALRDPELISPPADEDEPQGVLRR